MHACDHLYADASADPRLHGIARGLGLLLTLPSDDEVPDDPSDLLARLDARDDWDGPDREGDGA